MDCKSTPLDVTGLLNGGRCMHCDSENATFLVVITVNGVAPEESGTACDEECAHMYIREASAHFIRRQIKKIDDCIQEEKDGKPFAQKMTRVRAVSRNCYRSLLQCDRVMYLLFKAKATELWPNLLAECPDDKAMLTVSAEMKSWFENCETGEEYFFKRTQVPHL